jgi:RimJ/RimL family protein N-acetyltransferase
LPFQDESLELRPFEAEDLKSLQAVLNHPELSGKRYLPDELPGEIPLSAKQVAALLDKWAGEEKAANLAVVLSENQELIGHAEMEWKWDPRTPWVSVVISPIFQHHGYGSQVLRLILRYLFSNTVAHNVSGWMADWNQAAYSFAKRHGFQDAGRSRREGIRGGVFYDGIIVDMLRPEWQATQEG